MKHIVRLLIALGLAFFLTAPKLYKVGQIRGWVPGAIVATETITQKWNQTPEEHYRGRDVYWIAWTATDIRTVGNHRVNVTEKKWRDLHVGDEVEVTRVPGDPAPYLQDGIYASAENFAFDVVLLFVELGVAGYSLGTLTGHRNTKTGDDEPVAS